MARVKATLLRRRFAALTRATRSLCHLGVVRVESTEWSLSIDGLVERPRTLRFEVRAMFLEMFDQPVAFVHESSLVLPAL
jgi:hypothetical protein